MMDAKRWGEVFWGSWATDSFAST